MTTHTKKEVITRQWQDSSGAVMTLLDFRVEEVEGRPTIAVAKYGDKATTHVHCVDIYEYRQTPEPSDAALFLLCHDNRKGWVAELRIEQKDDQVFFNFLRQFADLDALKTIQNSYSYRYDRKTGFSETTGDYYQELSPK